MHNSYYGSLVCRPGFPACRSARDPHVLSPVEPRLSNADLAAAASWRPSPAVWLCLVPTAPQRLGQAFGLPAAPAVNPTLQFEMVPAIEPELKLSPAERLQSKQLALPRAPQPELLPRRPAEAGRRSKVLPSGGQQLKPGHADSGPSEARRGLTQRARLPCGRRRWLQKSTGKPTAQRSRAVYSHRMLVLTFAQVPGGGGAGEGAAEGGCGRSDDDECHGHRAVLLQPAFTCSLDSNGVTTDVSQAANASLAGSVGFASSPGGRHRLSCSLHTRSGSRSRLRTGRCRPAGTRLLDRRPSDYSGSRPTFTPRSAVLEHDLDSVSQGSGEHGECGRPQGVAARSGSSCPLPGLAAPESDWAVWREVVRAAIQSLGPLFAGQQPAFTAGCRCSAGIPGPRLTLVWRDTVLERDPVGWVSANRGRGGHGKRGRPQGVDVHSGS